MNIFDIKYNNSLKKIEPLAERMRPTDFDAFVGQEHIVGKGRILSRAIQSDKLTSAIFYGPPGTGKTTLAKIIASKTCNDFTTLNAVMSGIKDIKEKINIAIENISMYNKRTILFIDEIHRFNKSQQDALLPYVENGTIILIGATTENPYFEVNNALLSRSLVFEFKKLSEYDIKNVIDRVVKDKNNGYGNLNVNIHLDAVDHIIENSNGDIRKVLNAIELGISTMEEDTEGVFDFALDVAEDCIQQKKVLYDKKGDNHFDTVSAFIKSMRGTDPDAAIFWLAKMIKAGEDPKYIARRIIISASEDVGNADPRALQVAINAFNAVEIIGMPEGRIILAQAVLYIACAPKSNASYMAIKKALADVEKHETKVPTHLCDKSYAGAKKLGRGKGYKYPHNYDNSYVPQQYLPNELLNTHYYNPIESGYESKIRKFLKYLETDK